MALTLCLAGAWISAMLVKEQAGPWPSSARTPGLFSRLCGTGENGESGCAAVLNSRWGAVDVNIPVVTGGLTLRRSRVVVPVAFIGLAYFVFLAVWYAFAGKPGFWGRWWRLVPLSVTLGGAVGSVVLLWILILRLELQCTWCLVVHVINGLLLISTLSMCLRRGTTTTTTGRQTSAVDSIGVNHAMLTPSAAFRAVGFAVLAILGMWAYHGAKLDIRRQVAVLLPYKEFVEARISDPGFLLREYYAEPQVPIPERNGNDQVGVNSDEPTVVIFADLQGEDSACFAVRWRNEFRSLWRGPLQVSFRHFPLSRACNPAVTEEIHAEACQVAYAAEAARLQGGDEAFWKMHDLLFGHRRRLGETSYAKLAETVGLDVQRLYADMESDAVRQIVAGDIALAGELGVTSAPTLFLNGRAISQVCLYNPVFWQAASEEIATGASVPAHASPSAASGERVVSTVTTETGEVSP